MDRAYSIFEVKSLDDEQRVIRGMATTPTPDREQDVVEPMGVKSMPTIPLFLYHDSRLTVGTVKLGRPTPKGIPFEATIPKVVEAGNLRDRVDEAWQLVKYKLIAAVSIGFRPVADKIEQLKTGGLRFLESEVLELSLVPVPMNAEATITSIKSFDQTQRAATGHTRSHVVRLNPPPGVSGTPEQPAKSGLFYVPKGTEVKTFAEQIAGFEAKRAASAARQAEIMEKSAEAGETLSKEQAEEYDTLTAEIKAVDEHLTRLKAHEAAAVKSAAVVNDGGTAVEVRGNVVAVKRNVPKGTGLTRFAMALAHSKGNLVQAEHIAKRWADTPEVAAVMNACAQAGSTNLKAAVSVGDSNTSGWASQLVYYGDMQSEFIDLLRPKTIIGRMPGLRRVPFNIRVGATSTGTSSAWVGENNPIPASSMAFTSVTLGHAKAASLVAITQELANYSSPAAEALVRDDMIAAMTQFLDQQFIDPSVAASANVSPAAITNGLTPVNSTGSTVAAIYTDVQTLMTTFDTAELATDDCVWVMKPGTARALSMKRTSQDIAIFPDINQNGGMWFGLPVITSNSVPGSTSGGSIIALVKASEVFFADDGGVTLDVSQEASVQMVTNPSTGAQSLVSLWQNGLVGLRAIRDINWQRRRTAAVNYIDGVAY